MGQPERRSRMAALLFTDMVDSVALQGRLGTVGYARLWEAHHQLFLKTVEFFPGAVVRDEAGDGFLSEFDTAADAVNAALLFQLLLREAKWEQEAPKVRIGIHAGQLAEIKLEGQSREKVVGMPLNIAARVMSLAQGGQILMTRPVCDDAKQFVRDHPLPPGVTAAPPKLRWKDHGAYLCKGSEDLIEVFEVGAMGFAPFATPPDSEKIRRSEIRPRIKTVRVKSPAMGAALAIVCGLLFWGTERLREPFENASYDFLFLASRPTNSNLAIIFLDEKSRMELRQPAGQPWNRTNHTALLRKLAADENKLVVFDVFFRETNDVLVDNDLANAIRAHGRVILAADPNHKPAGLHPFFLDSALNWGYGHAGVQVLETPRWESFEVERELRSLPASAATEAGARPDNSKGRRWLRYYGPKGAWEICSYKDALTHPKGFFRDKVVFVGRAPTSPFNWEPEDDKFKTPYSDSDGRAVGGVEILATEFLNRVNEDWLRRPAWWIEMFLLAGAGGWLGGGLCRLRPSTAGAIAFVTMLSVALAAIFLSFKTNYWFPWLLIAGLQAPIAFVWSLYPGRVREGKTASVPVVKEPKPAFISTLPEAPDYELFDPPFGEGGFGKVWLVRNAIGQWQALKAVYKSKFGEITSPYEAEFKGIERYKPVSEKHPGLLRIDFVSRMKPEGYFYYVMELGDGQTTDWETNPASYKPSDLSYLLEQSPNGCLPLKECVLIGMALAEALEFLHGEGLTHRDIKPSNVIFVDGEPKLADIGLVSAIRATNRIKTYVGSFGYMPPHPEPPGTVAADIYALGVLLYVASVGREPETFADRSTEIIETPGRENFALLEVIIKKATQLDPNRRYASASEMRAALTAAYHSLDKETTGI